MVEKFDPKKELLGEQASAQTSADIVKTLGSAEEQAWFENELIRHRSSLKHLANSASNFERAEIELQIAEALVGLNKLDEAWQSARPLVELFIDENNYAYAVRACRVLYQTDREESIAALGQACWLAVTYPIDPALSIEMLHYIIDETPDQSDGAAVAAMAAHYIADMRGAEQHENLTFLTKQILAKVAKRHRNIEDEESIKIWIEILELNDTDQLFERLAKIIDVMVDDQWWFSRDELRAQLPVN